MNRVLLGLATILLSSAWGQTDWPSYGHDQTGQRYSPLKRINTANVAKLKMAWQYGVNPAGVDNSPANRVTSGTEAVPIMVNGVLYAPTVHRNIVALEPETGKELWKYDLGKASAPLRGVTYWQGDKDSPAAVMAGTSDGHLIAINARTGKLVPGFGNEGVVDLRVGVTEKFPDAAYHMASPGAVSYTSTPVRELAWKATSGTPRPLVTGVEPAGSLAW